MRPLEHSEDNGRLLFVELSLVLGSAKQLCNEKSLFSNFNGLVYPSNEHIYRRL